MKSIYNVTDSRPQDAISLNHLRDILNYHYSRKDKDFDLIVAELLFMPKFGGDHIYYEKNKLEKHQPWSWDEDNVLMGNERDGGWHIISRKKWSEYPKIIE